jgi:hypothetical protein
MWHFYENFRHFYKTENCQLTHWYYIYLNKVRFKIAVAFFKTQIIYFEPFLENKI